MREQIFDILEKICEDDIVRSNPDIDLFESDLMDSLGFAELLADIEDVPWYSGRASEVDRSTFNTPNRIVAYLETGVRHETASCFLPGAPACPYLSSGTSFSGQRVGFM